MGFHNPAVDDWIDQARKAPVWDVMCQLNGAHGLQLKGHKAVGPCPGCGGRDRFTLDAGRNSWFCRKLYSGGDAIALAMHILACDFLRAVEEINGCGPPQGQGGAAIDLDAIKAREEERQRDAAQKAREAETWRNDEINRAAVIWKEGRPIDGTAAQAYLALRAIRAAAGSRLRFQPKLAFWHRAKGWDKPRIIHEGPAMLARIDDSDHHFRGVHITYIDLAGPKGKLQLADPVSGDGLDAKKIRGSPKGCHIHLFGNPHGAAELKIGEGIETTLSVLNEMQDAGLDLADQLFWAGINLGNLGGPAVETVRHPSLTMTDVRGRVRAIKVRGPQPAWPHDHPILMPPAQIADVLLLGDGDSDRFATEQDLRRAAALWTSDARRVRHCFAEEDFNAMRMKASGVAA